MGWAWSKDRSKLVGREKHVSYRVQPGMEPGYCPAEDGSCSPKNWWRGGHAAGLSGVWNLKEGACW